MALQGPTNAMELTSPKVDGRSLRKNFTRSRAIEGTLQLAREGNHRLRVEDIANAARISIRSVFQHFDCMNGLYCAVAEQVKAEALTSFNLPIVGDRSLRLEQFLQRHHDACEVLLLLFQSLALRNVCELILISLNGHIRGALEQLLEDRLEVWAPERRRPIMDALVAELDPEVWAIARLRHGISSDELRKIVGSKIRRLM